MYIDEIAWCKTILCLIFLLARLILIVDTARPRTTSTSRQMCTKLQSMLSFGKYQTSQISSNVTYTSRLYSQNFLAYSSIDDLLIFIEPKHQIHVYNGQTIQLLVNLTTTDVVIATSTTSLITDSRHAIYFIYQTYSETNLISLRVCQVRFDMFQLKFEDKFCIETINIQYDQSDLRINGFTIKRDHAGTKKSLLFISTDIGLIYTVFDTHLGSLIGESTIMNETLNEGSIVISSSGVVYYASKQEHLIYELHIQRDFRLRHGKIIKANAIKYPFGLITDECNHLYIATRSMILIMYVHNRATIRSVFSKASDLPITLERLNSTTYVYGTIKKSSAKSVSHWMFNFLYFTDPERGAHVTRYPVVNLEEKSDQNDTITNTGSMPKLWPLTYQLSSSPNATKMYTRFNSIPRQPFARFRKNNHKQTQTTISNEQDSPSFDENKYFTINPSHDQTITELMDDFQSINPDGNIDIDDNFEFDPQDQSLENNFQFDNDLAEDKTFNTNSFSSNPPKSTIPIDDLQKNLTTNQNSSSFGQTSDSYLISTSTSSPHRTIEIAGIIFSEDEIQSYFEGHQNLTSSQEAHINIYLAQQSSSDDNILAKYFKTTNKPNGTINIETTIFTEEDIQSYLEGRGNLSRSQKERIEAYLAKQSSLGYTLLTKFFKTTNRPIKFLPSESESNQNFSLSHNSQSQSNANESISTDSKSSNRTIDIDGTLFSEDEIQSYLEGIRNFTANQEAQIQDYIASQRASNNTIFSRYSKSTKPVTRIFVSDDNNSSQNYLTRRPSFDFNLYPEYFDHIIDSNGTVISNDDLQLYLEGRLNLSASQEILIQTYLARQSSSFHNIFSKYSKNTTSPSRLMLPNEDLFTNSSTNSSLAFDEDWQLETYLKYLNRTNDTDEVLFSYEDLKAYLRGNANISVAQKTQIQAYLAAQSSTSYNGFFNYSISTKKPRRSSIPGRGIQSEHQWKGNLSLTEDIQSEDYSEELLPTDLPSYNRTIDPDELPFSEDDLRAYLEGRVNLSTSQIIEIQAYLFKQLSSNQSIFSRYPNRTELLTKILSKYFNLSTDLGEVIFSDDDIQAYREERANLSLAQQAQIQVYLAKQSSSSYNVFSNYSTSTKRPRRISIPGRGIHSEHQWKGNLSLTEDTQFEDYSEELLPTDLPSYNRTIDPDELPFSEDDLQAYLEDRANLSANQIIEIQAYLFKQLSSNQSIFSRYPNKTRLLTKIFSKYFNLSTDLEEVFLSEDDIQTYLEGRANLSLAQQAQIQTYLAKQTSLTNKTFSRYWTSTIKPTKISISDETLKVNLEGQTNLSESAQIHSSGSASPKLTSTKPYSTRRRTGGKQPIQSVLNGTDDFDANMEQISDIYFDSNEENNRSTDIFNDYSHTSQDIDDYDQQMTIEDYDEKINPSRFPKKLRSTIHPRFTRITSQQSFPTNIGSIPFNKTSKPALSYPFAIDVDHISSDSVVISHDNTTIMPSLSIGEDLSDPDIDVNQTQISSIEINGTIMPFIHQRNTSSQNQSDFTDTWGSYDDTEDSYDDVDNNNIENEISHEYSSPLSVALDVSSTLHPLSPFSTPNTTRSSSHRSSSSTPLHYSLASLSTKSPKSTRPSTSKFFSGVANSTITESSSEEITSNESEPTTVLSYSTIFPLSTSKQQSSHKFSSMQTTDIVLTSTIPKETSTDEQLFTTKSDQYTSTPHIQTSSLSYTQSTTLFPSTNLDFSSTKLSDQTSSHSTVDEKYRAFETTEIITSTSFPDTSKLKTLSTLERIHTSTISTSTTTTTTTTTRRLRTGKQKFTRQQTQQLPITTTIVPLYQTTTIHDYQLTTTNKISSLDESPSNINDSSTVITNDLLNKIFNNHSTSTNSSSEKSMFFNLSDLPPSTWNLSLNSNDSILLNFLLPTPNNSNTTTNLTFTNIEANRFSTNINGIPINLQVDRVQTKHFSLIMNVTDNNRNRTNKHLSDVIIGHVKSEQFELNLTKSDNMNVHVQQVDSTTAELYLDSNFCTNESSLEINLNLSKNGTIRYGNRKPIHIGPVFTRVHMLKQSCDNEQPLTLFFDICERENPCINGGTCVSILPDYNDKSFIPTETGHIGYRCQCPVHASGEHCQKSEYPLGYCLNDGTLFQIFDRFNQSIETCICPRGFRGEHCEENIDNCFGIGCSDHGVCEDGIETYKCSCFDGFYGFHCERTNVQTVLIQAASRSFGVTAILLIASIASLVVASDIHTYLTRKQEKHNLLHKIPRVTSELFENSVLLLGFRDAPIEMNDLSNVGTKKKPVVIKSRQTKRITRTRRHASYRQITRRRQLTTFPKSSSRRYLVSGQTIL